MDIEHIKTLERDIKTRSIVFKPDYCLYHARGCPGLLTLTTMKFIYLIGVLVQLTLALPSSDQTAPLRAIEPDTPNTVGLAMFLYITHLCSSMPTASV